MLENLSVTDALAKTPEMCEQGTAILLSDTMKCSLSTFQTGCSSLQGHDLSNTPKIFLHESSEEHSHKTAKLD